MLTVKHIRDGIETIYDAPDGVQFVGPDAPEGVDGAIVGLTILGNVGRLSAGQYLMDGIAYVMNDAGQTVGTYRLPSSQPVVAE